MNAFISFIVVRVIILLYFKNVVVAIVNGYNCASKKDPPVFTKFMLAISTYPGQTICSGTLLNPRWVLTAAHCVEYPARKYVVEGVARDKYNLGKLVWYPPAIKIKNIYLHPKFEKEPFVNNIALIHLAFPIFEHDDSFYVKIPSEPNTPAIGIDCVIMGYGQTVGVPPPPWHQPKLLQCVNQEIKVIQQRDKIVCTESNVSGICYGDCGGPIVCDSIQIGINSYTTEDNCSGRACYTLVGEYLDFIYETIKNRGLRIASSKLLLIYPFTFFIFHSRYIIFG